LRTRLYDRKEESKQSKKSAPGTLTSNPGSLSLGGKEENSLVEAANGGPKISAEILETSEPKLSKNLKNRSEGPGSPKKTELANIKNVRFWNSDERMRLIID